MSKDWTAIIAWLMGLAVGVCIGLLNCQEAHAETFTSNGNTYGGCEYYCNGYGDCRQSCPGDDNPIYERRGGHEYRAHHDGGSREEDKE